ncbi:UNKNOWN [Stylonychia lemnae]|uniref:Uncharacterized protein n=1 Tax=Stylonychia lemnae TaxID=5949 RepID=A0A077ZV12_STYLE|nr:UNKNOWN [Stylonychia lemnae]|eukprot:CDW72276.1 UNKNOWN [Stylonychia lemnae]
MLIQAQEQKHLAQRLINLKSTVDNREPKKFQHLASVQSNEGSLATIKKKQFNSMVRQKQIDQENSLLLKKMLEIIQRKNQSFRDGDPQLALIQMTQQQQQQNTKDDQSIDDSKGSGEIMITSERKKLQNSQLQNEVSNMQNQTFFNGSLNYHHRKQEYEQIQKSNKVMLKHLKEIKPSIKRGDWQDHIKKYEHLKNQLQNNKTRHISPSQNNNNSVLLPILSQSKSIKGDAREILQERSFLQSSSTSQRFNLKKDDSNKQELNNQTNADNITNQRMDQYQSQSFKIDENHTTQDTQSVTFKLNKSAFGTESNQFTVNQTSQFANQLNTKNAQSANRIQSRLEKSAHQSKVNDYSNKRDSMTRSVPRPRGYFDNILKSPLLNFANYPESILRKYQRQLRHKQTDSSISSKLLLGSL